MDKMKENINHKVDIKDFFKKLIQFLYLDGNYKKRSFILDNFASGLCYRMREEFYPETEEIYWLATVADLFGSTKNDDFFTVGHHKIYTRILQIYSILRYDFNNNPTRNNDELNKYLNQLLDNKLKILDIPLSYISDYFNEGLPQERIRKFKMFNSLTVKYNLYIYDLIAPINYDYSCGLKEWINKNDEPLSNIYKPFPTLEFCRGIVNIEKLEKSSIIQNRFYNLLSLLEEGKNITKPQRATLRNLLRQSELLSQIHNSFETRKIGLYLWDMCKNPLNPDLIDYNDLINNLYNINIRASRSKNDFRRTMLSYLNKTDECIKKGKFLPYTN